MEKILSLLTTLSLCGITAAIAQDEYPKKAFDATYSMTTGQGTSTIRMASDGKGKWLQETNAATMKSKTIVDYLAKSSVTYIDPSKMAMKSPFNQTADRGITDETSAKKYNAKSLGEKVIDGHPCKGWLYNMQGAQNEVWVGNDIQQMVRSETTTSAGKSSMVLKTYSPKAPPDAAFVGPSGYKFISVPGQ